jgi:hypothetical protein
LYKESPLSNEFFDRVRFRGEPVADPHAVVLSGNARFTVLTSRLLRLEWSENGQFEDRGSFAFPTRRASVPPFVTRTEGRTLIIETSALQLRYRMGTGKFTARNLSITFKLNRRRVAWKPGTADPGNLRGTRRTVDGCEGDSALDEGILSRSGWALHDDSRQVLFSIADGWVQPRPEQDVQDWYFFAFGHDYKGGLAEYMRFGGNIPLIPRFVLGTWWSRYWAYSSQDLKDIVQGFEQHDLPLEVFIIDMDWHLDGWTGYTWNRDLIPDPEALLDWIHAKGLKTALNLHPADGVGAHEAMYPQFARAMGIDPATKERIPFHITDKRFTENYFKLLHHPMEQQGVDFWWVDWQQGDISEMKGLDPLLWLNHLHFWDSGRRNKRCITYSRWYGLGNHRYQTGFSGDTVVGWSALQFQPYYTATASNVGYGWWEHDIGGHMGGATEPELFARWVQFGALSPALKLHGTKDVLTERRPWVFPKPTYEACKAAFHWRYQLVPYIYSMARQAADTGVSLCRPMYYEHPEEEHAYSARFQYYYGDQMIAAPIVHPAGAGNHGMAAQDVWLPAGEWVDYQTKELYASPRPHWVRVTGDLMRMPMFMKTGAILPLAPQFKGAYTEGMASGNLSKQPRDHLLLSVFPGKQGSFRFYEDDGESESYRNGDFEWTPLSMAMPDERTWNVTIAPVEGRCAGLPAFRSYEVCLEGSARPENVLVDGTETSAWTYDARTLTTTIQVQACSKAQIVQVSAVNRRGMRGLSAARNRRLAKKDVEALSGTPLKGLDTREKLMRFYLDHPELPERADALARLGGPLVSFFEYVTPEEAVNQLGRVVIAPPRGHEESCDVDVLFTLYRGSGKQEFVVHHQAVKRDLILDTPFAYEGEPLAAHWTAEVKLTYFGKELVYRYDSTQLFPAISAYHARIFNPEKETVSLEEALHPASNEGWLTFIQEPRSYPNLNSAHYAPLFRVAWQKLQGKEPLAAWLVTKIDSPEARPADLLFMAMGKPEMYLNGGKIEQTPVEVVDVKVPRVFMRGEALRLAGLPLQKGENTLAIRLSPDPDQPWWGWVFGGMFVNAANEVLTDLKYE